MATPAPETQHHISSCMTTDEIKARCADASIDFIQPGPGCYPHAWTLACGSKEAPARLERGAASADAGEEQEGIPRRSRFGRRARHDLR